MILCSSYEWRPSLRLNVVVLGGGGGGGGHNILTLFDSIPILLDDKHGHVLLGLLGRRLAGVKPGDHLALLFR